MCSDCVAIGKSDRVQRQWLVAAHTSLPAGIEGDRSTRGHWPANAAPCQGSVILIGKRKPSAFFGTLFMSHLNFLDVDTLIMTGCTTSGCLRATTVDAYSYNFKVVIPEETAFDRFECSHAVNLFDLNCKYADVAPASEVEAYLIGLPVRPSPER
jgi:nicotinamidase-related amidase